MNPVGALTKPDLLSRHCFYLSNGTDWHATEETGCVITVYYAPGNRRHEACHIGPDAISLTERGKGINTNYINNFDM
jgi:5-deoxy-glucuronate isomerase